jgi:hypothetical protein
MQLLTKRRRLRRIAPAVLILLLVATVIWGSDRITLQGERTIYTVDCAQGAWEGNRCTGRLVTGPRHAFRASRSRNEVIYWVRESQRPSQKFTDCTVKNRDNWTCNVRVGEPGAVTYEFRDGKPTRGTEGLTLAYHDVPKWQWWAIKWGLGGAFATARS